MGFETSAAKLFRPARFFNVMSTDTVTVVVAEAGLFRVAFFTQPATFPVTVDVPAAIAVPAQAIAADMTPLHINRDLDFRNTRYPLMTKCFG